MELASPAGDDKPLNTLRVRSLRRRCDIDVNANARAIDIAAAARPSTLCGAYIVPLIDQIGVGAKPMYFG